MKLTKKKVIWLIVLSPLIYFLSTIFIHITQVTRYQITYDVGKGGNTYSSAAFLARPKVTVYNPWHDKLVFGNPYKMDFSIDGPFDRVKIKRAVVMVDGKETVFFGKNYDYTSEKYHYFPIYEEVKIPVEHAKKVVLDVTFIGMKKDKEKEYHERISFTVRKKTEIGNIYLESISQF